LRRKLSIIDDNRFHNLGFRVSFHCSNANFQKGLPTMSKKQNRRSAFSLLELLAVVTSVQDGTDGHVIVQATGTSGNFTRTLSVTLKQGG
jgi:hypothetical protein